MNMMKKTTVGFLTTAMLLSTPAIDAFQFKAEAAAGLTVTGGDANNHFEDNRSETGNGFLKYVVDGENIATGVVLNTVTFEFASAMNVGLEIQVYSNGEYHDMTAIDVSNSTNYCYDFWLGGEYRARIVNDGTPSDYVEFSVEVPDTDGDGEPEFNRDSDFITYLEQQILAGKTEIDVSGYNIPCEDLVDGEWKWNTWNELYRIRDWNGIIGCVQFSYDHSADTVDTITISDYNVADTVEKEIEFEAYLYYVQDLVDKLLPDDEYYTDIEKATILSNYFCEYIGDIYADGGESYNSLWRKDALCDGCAKGFGLLCQLAGLNHIKGGSGVSSHAWGIVQVNGSWYHVDALWSINNYSAYFLRTDEEMIKDHNGEFTNYGEDVIYWAHTDTEGFPSCIDTGYQGDNFIFRQATSQIYYDRDDEKWYYYVEDYDKGEYAIYWTDSVVANYPNLIKTVTDLNDFFEYIDEPDMYLYTSDDEVLSGDKLYVSAGAPYYTNAGDTKQTKYKGMDVRASFEGTGIVSDYKYEIYDADGTLLNTVQGAMYTVTPIVMNGVGKYTIKAICEGENGKSSSISKTVNVISDCEVKDTFEIWANGGKVKQEDGSAVDYKTTTITTDLTATNWTNASGKETVGKILWTARDAASSPKFNTTTHALTTKSDSNVVTVANGKVTAKAPGVAYVFASDSGTMQSEMYKIVVKNAPTAIYCYENENSYEERNLKGTSKNVNLQAGNENATSIWIYPYAKTGEVSDDCTYTVTVKQTGECVSVKDIEDNNEGDLFLTISGKDIAKAGAATKVTVTVTCDQSGKKGTFTATVFSPVGSIKTAAKGTVAVGKLPAKLYLQPETGSTSGKFSEKLQVCVSAEEPQISEDGKKFVYTKSKDVTASLDKNYAYVALSTKKAIAEELGVYALLTDPATKQLNIIKLAAIDTDGKITPEDEFEREVPENEIVPAPEFEEDEVVIWANGAKIKQTDGSYIDYKNATVTPEIEATSWTNTAGKTTAGKLVWTAMLTEEGPEIDTDKHTVFTKSDKTVATAAKNKITAVSGGADGEAEGYVYVTDTGSFESIGYKVTVKNAPTNIYLFADAEETDTKKAVKTITATAGGEAEVIYLIPYAKQGKVSDDATYSVDIKQTGECLEASEIKTDENGRLYVELTALDIAKSGAATKVTVNIICNESNKKAALTVNIVSPITKVTGEVEGKLDKVGATAALTLDYETGSESGLVSDAIQLAVSADDPVVDATGKTVTFTKSTEVTATMGKTEPVVTLKAAKAVTTEVNVYMILTDAAAKTKSFVKIATISADGTVEMV